jgi:molecular chaperone Hsp33
MMGAMMKGEDDLLTLQIRGSGPMKGITVTAGSPDEETGMVDVKGYALVPDAMLPARVYPLADGPERKLDVGGAIGIGVLSVIKDMGLKEPYSSQVALQTGEIAEDLTYYFATSEQVPSAVGLGVLMEKNNTVRQAGGFIIQLMPFASDETIDFLEERLKDFSYTELLDKGLSPEDIINKLFEGYDTEFTDKLPCAYVCDCSRERVEQAVISLGRKEISAMIAEDKPVEVVCDFCRTKYSFSPEELLKFLKERRV